jgi:hypothetical protein
MKWRKVYLREMDEEEKEFFKGYPNEIWDGDIPELNEEVLVTFPLPSGEFADTTIDTWVEFDNGVGFEYTDDNIIYWMEMPKYNGELEE